MSAAATFPRASSSSRSDRFLAALAALMLLTAVALLIDPPASVPMAGGLVSIGRLSTEGAVRRRHARRLEWREETGEVPLFKKDFVYTPSGVSAQVELDDGRIVALPPDTLIQFDEVTLRDIEIVLKDVVRELKRPQAFFRAVPLPKNGAAASLGSVESLVNAAAVVEKKLEALKSRPLALVSTKSLSPARLALDKLHHYDVRLLAPASAERIPFKGTRWLDIAWTAIPLKGVVYELELSRDRAFTQKIPYRAKSTSLKIQMTKAGDYFWRVRARRGSQSIVSATQNFSLEAASGRAASVATPAKSTLRAKKGAAYTAEIARDDRFTDVVRTDSVASPACLSRGLKSGRYHCRVRTLSGIQPLREYDFEVK